VSENNNLRVVVVDDSEVVRMKLRGLLEANNGFELIGEAENGESGLRLVQEHQPDLVIMDLRMPGMSGIEATWQLGTVAPSSRVLVLTVSAEQEDVTDAIMAGARGYVVKGAKDAEIMAALRGVAAGERVISPQVAGKLIQRVRGEHEESMHTTPSPAAPAAPRMRAPAPRPARVVEREPSQRADAPVPVGLVQAVGLVGGIVITAIGQGEVILDGVATSDTWLKAVANVVIALVVANLALLIARFGD
jgi:DNA-binding NarL/FixJ family response regulator